VTHRCPDEETLAAYFDCLLAPEEEAALHAELLECPDCANLVGALGMVLRTEEPDAWRHALAPPTAVTQRAMDLWPDEPSTVVDALRIAARWLGDQLAPLADALQPMPVAAATVRGAAATSEGPQDELRYQVTLGDVPLEVDLEVDSPKRLALTVRPLHPPPAGTMLRLTAAGETRAMSTLTLEGTTLPALPVGDYELTLELADRPLGRFKITLDE